MAESEYTFVQDSTYFDSKYAQKVQQILPLLNKHRTDGTFPVKIAVRRGCVESKVAPQTTEEDKELKAALVTRYAGQKISENVSIPRVLSDIKLSFYPECCNIPTVPKDRNPTLEFGRALSVSHPDRNTYSGTYDTTITVNENTSRVCIDITNNNVAQQTEEEQRKKKEDFAALALLNLGLQDFDMNPDLMYFWMEEGHVERGIPSKMSPFEQSLVTFVMYVPYSCTVGEYVRRHVHTHVANMMEVAGSAEGFTDYIVSIMEEMIQCMIDYIKGHEAGIEIAYTIAHNIDDYVLYEHDKLGFPYKLSVTRWNWDDLLSREYMIPTYRSMERTLGDPSTADFMTSADRHVVISKGNPKMRDMFIDVFRAQLSVRDDDAKRLLHYAFSLFVSVLANEVLDVLEMERTEILGHIFAMDTKDSPAVIALDGCDKCMDEIQNKYIAHIKAADFPSYTAYRPQIIEYV
jgi:hypothetical protein